MTVAPGGSAPLPAVRTATAAQVEELLDYPSLVERLRTAFTGDIEAPLRHHHALPTADGADAIMLLKPVWRPGGPVAVKIVNIFSGNAARGLPSVLGTVLLFDGETGAPRAVIDGQALTVRRTAAASALAADYLARRDARRLVVVGTGQLAPALAEAHAAVRPIDQVEVWGRSPEKARATAALLSEAGLAARSVSDLAAAVGAADIVTCATLTKEPLVHGAWLGDGTHLDLVGGFTPEMREADDDAVRRAAVFVDTREGALAEAGDIIQPIAAGVISEGDVAGDLADLCRGAHLGRRDDSQVTLFKSVGTALEDLAAAELVVERL